MKGRVLSLLYDIQVTYRRTTRVSLRVGKYGDVRVSAPFGFPKKEIERFVEERKEWITEAQERMKKRLEKCDAFYSQLPLGTLQERKEAVDRMNAIIPPLVERYSMLMKVHPSGISYKATISKWGSCATKTGQIQFSIYLLLLPEWCIEHIVVHELAHLIEPSHGARFYKVMDQFFPRWRQARKETRRISRMEAEE